VASKACTKLVKCRPCGCKSLKGCGGNVFARRHTGNALGYVAVIVMLYIIRVVYKDFSGSVYQKLLPIHSTKVKTSKYLLPIHI